MSKGAQADFYKTKAWQHCRDTYLAQVGGLCEDCLKKGIYKPAIIVHHKEHITTSNLLDPEVTLNYSNLRAVCRDCHAKYHSQERRYKVDEYGRVTIKDA